MLARPYLFAANDRQIKAVARGTFQSEGCLHTPLSSLSNLMLLELLGLLRLLLLKLCSLLLLLLLLLKQYKLLLL